MGRTIKSIIIGFLAGVTVGICLIYSKVQTKYLLLFLGTNGMAGATGVAVSSILLKGEKQKPKRVLKEMEDLKDLYVSKSDWINYEKAVEIEQGLKELKDGTD